MAYEDSTAVCACPERCATFTRTFSQRTRKYAVGCRWYAKKLEDGRAAARKERRVRERGGDTEPRKRGPKPGPGNNGPAAEARRKQCQTCFDQGHRRESPKCRGCDRPPSPDASLTKASARGIQYAATELVVETQEETEHENESIDETSLLDADGRFRVRGRRRRRRSAV